VPPAEARAGRAAAAPGVDLPQRVRRPHQPLALCRHRRRRAYRPGKFVNAAADKASEDNERMAIALRRNDGVSWASCRSPGWVRRRIVCYVKPGQALAPGERFGHIRFGSRTDLYLPAGARLLVAPGQRMIAARR
jgi:phosphatidylserine decarboxylase